MPNTTTWSPYTRIFKRKNERLTCHKSTVPPVSLSMVIGMTTVAHIETYNQHRPLLFGIAWRMLGNPSDAEDILQEGLLRWLRTNPLEVRSPRAFLVTVITRLCLNHLDLSRVKKEVPLELDSPQNWLTSADINP